MWGDERQDPPPAWSWVKEQLSRAGTYWVISRSPGYPHPRPVWGVWVSDKLFLSIGSQVIARELGTDPRVTVHLESSTNVVIVEGRAGPVSDSDVLDAFASAYNSKYDWQYSVETDGSPTQIEPERIFAWRAAGEAGRDGFTEAVRWTF